MTGRQVSANSEREKAEVLEETSQSTFFHLQSTFFRAPAESRTRNPQIRSLMLYPIELQVRERIRIAEIELRIEKKVLREDFANSAV